MSYISSRLSLPPHNPDLERRLVSELKDNNISDEKKVLVIGELVVNNLRGVIRCVYKGDIRTNFTPEEVVSIAGQKITNYLTYDPIKARFLSYMIKITRNRLFNELRDEYRKRKHISRSLDDVTYENEESKLRRTLYDPTICMPIEDMAQKERIRLLRKAIETADLSKMQRYWWNQKYGEPSEKRRNIELASIKGVTPAVVCQTIANAKKKIAKRYKELDKEA